MAKRILSWLAASCVVLILGIAALYVSQLSPGRVSSAGVLVCANPIDDDIYSSNDSSNNYNEIAFRFNQFLEESETVELQVIEAALQSGNKPNQSALESLVALAENNPENPLPSLYALRACTHFPTHNSCDENLIDNAIVLNGDNAVAHALAAALHYQHGEVFDAAVALQNAVAAPEYDDFYTRSLRQHKDLLLQLAPEIEQPYHYLIFNNALEMLLNGYRSWRPVVEMCRNEVANNPLLANTCFNFADRMEQDTTVMLGRMQAYSLQQSTHLGVGNQAEFDRMEREARNVNNSSEANRLAFDLMRFDETLEQFWYESHLQDGELPARDLLTEEAIRLSSDPDYDPCSQVALQNTIYRVKDFTQWLFTRE